MSSTFRYCLLLFFHLISRANCGCREKDLFVQCDSFEDAKNSHLDKEEWTDLQIGSTSDTPKTSYHVMSFPLYNFNNLRTLTIYNHLTDLQAKTAYRCTISNKLHTISFYGNNIKNLKTLTIPVIEMDRLVMRHNNIEVVEAEAFLFHTIKFIDLSHNKIHTIEESSIVSSKTKTLWLQDNHISNLDPGSMPKTLEYLNLNNNQLGSLSNEVIQDLSGLKQLSLSGNRLHFLPAVRTLTGAVLLDFSYNSIQKIPGNAFANLDNLTFLDLSHNLIEDDSFLAPTLANNTNRLGVNLGFNRFTQMRVDPVPNLDGKTLWLFGNIWGCQMWDHLVPMVKQHQDRCDAKFFSVGSIPYCVFWKEIFYTDRREEGENFSREIDNWMTRNRDKLPCDLTPNKYEHLIPVDFGCVA